MQTSKESELKAEAVWVLSNATSNATLEQTQYLVNEGAFAAFNNVLGNKDPQAIIVALEGISFLLKMGASHMLDHNGESIYAQIAE